MSLKIQRSMASGAMWMVLFKMTERVLGAVSTVVLVRLLAPSEFGIVAMAVSFIAIAELLVAFGFDVALIKEHEPTVEHYHTAWTLNLLMGAGIALLMAALAKPVSIFYNRPEVFWVLLALALGPLISACENIGVVAFRKDLQFRREFAFQISRKLAGFVVVVPLAYWLHSYWALVAGSLAGKLSGTVMSYWVHEFRPRFSLAKAAHLFDFSKWLVLINVLSFVRTRMSDFLLGRICGPAVLGLFNVSMEFAYLPTTELSAPINRVLLPGFAQIGKDAPALSSAYSNAIGFIALLVIPAAAGIYAVADLLVPVVLGPNWTGAEPVLKVLAISGATAVLEGGIYNILLAIGGAGELTRINVVYIAVQFCLMLLWVGPFGALGAANAILIASLSGAPFYLYYLYRHTGIRSVLFLRAVARPTAAACLMVVTLYELLPSDVASLSFQVAAAWLAAGIGIGAATYTLALLLIWFAIGRPEGVERIALARVRAELGRRFSRAG